MTTHPGSPGAGGRHDGGAAGRSERPDAAGPSHRTFAYWRRTRRCALRSTRCGSSPSSPTAPPCATSSSPSTNRSRHPSSPRPARSGLHLLSAHRLVVRHPRTPPWRRVGAACVGRGQRPEAGPPAHHLPNSMTSSVVPMRPPADASAAARLSDSKSTRSKCICRIALIRSNVDRAAVSTRARTSRRFRDHRLRRSSPPPPSGRARRARSCNGGSRRHGC